MSLELCRLCGKDNSLTSVFDECDLSFKISTCFGVQIHKNDGVTKKICKSCYFFTNSVYEFRLSSLAHNIKLKAEYEESQPKIDIKADNTSPISYPKEISQDAFLNTFNLAHKTDVVIKKVVQHPSVVALKRKLPKINIPAECNELDLDPVVLVEIPPKLIKLNSDLGIWSVRSRQTRGKQPLVLTRVRNNAANAKESPEEGASTSETPDKSKIKSDDVKTNSPEIVPAKDKKKRKKYPDWCSTGKKKGRHFPPRKASPEKSTPPGKSPKITKRLKANNNKPQSVATTSKVKNNYLTLKNLLESDVQLNETLPKRPIHEPSVSRNEEYGNLLIAVGEEKQTFICQTCNKIFDTLALLNNHKKYNHASTLRCTKCSKRFAIVESLVNHNLTFHPETVESAPKTSDKKTNDRQTNDKKTNDRQTNDRETDEKQTDESQEDKQPKRKSVARKKTSGSNTSTRSSISSPPPIPKIMEYVISSDDDVEITDVIEKDTTSSDTTGSANMENIITAALEPQKPSNSEEINTDCHMLLGSPVPQVVFEQNTAEETVETEESKEAEDVFLIDDSDDEKEANEEPFLIEDDNNSGSSASNIRQSVAFKDADTSSIVDKDKRNKSSDNLPTTEAEPNLRQKIVVVPSAEDKAHMDAASSSSVKAKITNELSYVNYIFNKCSYIDIPGKTDKRWLLKDIHKFTEKTYLPIQLVKTTNEDISVEYGPVIPEKAENKLVFWDLLHAVDVTTTVPVTPSKISFPQEKKKIPVGKEDKVGTVGKVGPTSNKSLLKASLQAPLKILPATTTKSTTITNPAKVDMITSTIQNSPSFASNTVYVLANQQIQSASAPNVTTPNNKTPNIAVPSSSNQNLLNFALQNASQQKCQRSYSKSQPYTSIISKPVLPVSPNRAPNNQEQADKTISLQQSAPNGYILLGVSAAQLNNVPNEVDSNGMSKQPVVINGLSYPTFAKTRNSNQPTILFQQLCPQTNVNIQNCVNICQQDITTNTVSTVPFLIQNPPNTSGIPPMIPIAPSIQSTPPTTQFPSNITSNLPSNIPTVQSNQTENVSSDSCDSTTKPAIRIKNLSELRDNQRNELHNLYSNTLTTYVQNHSISVNSQPTSDEYLQIS